MSDLPIIIAFLTGAFFGYLIGRSRRATEFDVLQMGLCKVRNHLETLQRLHEAKERK